VTGIAEAVSALGTITSGISSAIGGAVSRALLIARATVDPTNWDLTALPAGVARNDARALGVFLWSHVATASADTFVQTVARPLSSFPIPRPLIDALAAELSRVVQSRTGQPTTITPEMLLALSVLSFAQFLHDRRIMTFRREPEQIANETLVAAGQ
jgi:hypothetical protein